MYVELLRKFDHTQYQAYQAEIASSSEKKRESFKLREEELEKIIASKQPADETDDEAPFRSKAKVELPKYQAKIIEKAPPKKTVAEAIEEAAAKPEEEPEKGARKIGVTIPGNMVVMVFHPKFAVRMLQASVPAGIEAPSRFYITENADGTTTLTYREPSSVFAPYDSAELDKMAKELDVIFARIAADASS